MGHTLVAYGVKYADTPNLDGLAAKGMIIISTRAISNSTPVCAPARTSHHFQGCVSDPSTGAEHMEHDPVAQGILRCCPVYTSVNLGTTAL